MVSSQPLPTFQDWWARCPNCPWNKEDAPPGHVYSANGVDPVEFLDLVNPNDRSKDAKLKGETPMANLAAWLRKMPSVETVQILGFTVLPKDKR